MSTHAEIIITNAAALTFDHTAPRAEALAITGGLISAVGSAQDVDNLRGPETRCLNAQGKTVLPGFIESHLHLFGGSGELDQLNLTGVAGLEQLAEQVQSYAQSCPDDAIVYAVGADYGILGERKPITRQDLDQVLAERPFAMMAPDHHTVWANTKALELGGILHGHSVSEGSEIVMAPDGTATGELLETGAFELITRHTKLAGRDFAGYTTGADPVPAPTDAQRQIDVDVIKQGLKHCAACGITSLHNMDGNFYQLELLEQIERDGALLCRCQIPFHLKNFDPLERLEEAVEMRRRYASDMLWSGRVKMFMDGVIDSYTALMLEPYPDRPDTIGDEQFSAEHFNEAAIKSDALGLQISVHAIGDGAVRRTLDGYEAARRHNGTRDARHRVEHIEVIHPDDIARFGELDVIASMQPLHSPLGGLFDAPPSNVILRDDLRKHAFPWSEMRKTAERLIFSSDWPVVDLEPMKSIKAAVAITDCGPDWGDNRQELHDALSAYTADGAFAEFNEDKKGRLKAGMMADIVVMSDNLETMAPETLDTAQPIATICAGGFTYLDTEIE